MMMVTMKLIWPVSELLSAKTKKKMEESLEPSGEKKSSQQVLEILSKDAKKVPMKLEVSPVVQTTSSIVAFMVFSLN